MTQLFADTSFYIASVNPRDLLHQAALDVAGRFRGTLVTTEYVLVETGNWLARTKDRGVFVDLLERLQADTRTLIVAASSVLFEQGVELYRGRLDKDWSLTDCISFVVMRQHGLSEALATDHHFEQAGFTILLRA